MAYPLIVPFLRGAYLTVNSWRPKRDKDGCKWSKWDYDSFVNFGRRKGRLGCSSESSEKDIAPKMVKAVGWLFKHLSALADLFKEDEPHLRLIRGAAILEVLYFFDGASGLGFGFSWKKGIYIGYWFGVWNEEVDGTKSNYRYFLNIAETLE